MNFSQNIFKLVLNYARHVIWHPKHSSSICNEFSHVGFCLDVPDNELYDQITDSLGLIKFKRYINSFELLKLNTNERFEAWLSSAYLGRMICLPGVRLACFSAKGIPSWASWDGRNSWRASRCLPGSRTNRAGACRSRDHSHVPPSSSQFPALQRSILTLPYMEGWQGLALAGGR